ncbi:Vps13a, partial [Symbiodinium sp. CCMP2456]
RGRVVAQLLTPQPDHRLLLLAPALRLHNETDLMLAVRFHEEARATVIKHLDSAICNASLLGLKSECEPAAAEPLAASCKSADNEWVCLPPNSICAVPAAATAQDGKSGDRTIISLRPAAWSLPDVDFSQPSSVGRKVVEGLSCKLGVGSSKSGYPHAGPVPLHFLVVQGSEDIGSGNGQKIKTLSIRPSMVFMNALPFGPLGLDIASTSSKAPPVVVEALQRVNFYGLSMQEMRGGLTLAAQLAPKSPWSGKVNLEGNDIVDITENVLGDEAKILDMKESTSGAPAAISLECLGHGQIRVSCSHWLLDRSGAQEKGLGKLEVFYQGAKLPSHSGITLLHAGCFENPCDLVLCPDGKSMKAKQTMKLPPSFESFVWNTPSGSLEMTLRIGSIKSSSVHGATCMQFTLAPRLVLTNASDVELELETPDKMKIRWKPRESRVLHWKANMEAVDPLATTFRFRPIGGGQCEFSGVVLCSDGSAGSTPFTLKRQGGGVEVWSVDVAPLHGSMGVLIRPGSDFIACNLLENRMEVQDEERPDERINVPAGGESVPIGWCKPFSGKRSRAVRVIVDKEIVDIPDLQRTAVRPLKTPGLALRVMRSGKTTKLSLEELHEKQQVQAKSQAFQATFELHVKLGRAGISLIDESPPQPCELFFFSLDMLRLEYMQDAARDSEKITVSVSEVQGICQLPDRTNDLDKVSMLDPSQLQRLHENLLQNQELPAVILANHSAGGKSFLQFQMTRQATSSRDLLLSAAQLDVDKLDFTVDEKWLTPLQQWLSHTFGAGGFDLFGVVAEELLSVAGKPITDGYIPPEVPAVVQAEDVNISAVDTTVWCSLRLKYLEFLPVYVRTALKVLSFSSYFTLDGVGLLLPARHLEPHRGSLQDYAMAVVSDYGTSILAHLGSLLGKSSLLNLPKAPLKLGGAVVAVMGDKLTDVTTGAASLLRNFTMDDEYIAKNREKKTITGAQQGFAAAGKTLMDGVEGMFDVVKKPVEGAQKEGLWGFATGLTKGVAGSIVKPVAAFGTAIGEVGTGLASTTNTLNDNEANQRRRARRRLRLPRLLFGELGEVRPFVDFEAQLYQRYGANIRGVCEVVLLDREEKGGDLFITSLLLFVDQLAVAVASNQAADAVPNKFERTFNILKKTDSSKVAPLRGLRFSQLQKVALEGTILKLVGSAKEVFSLDLDKANLSVAAQRALLSGLEAAAANGRLEAHRTWSQLRAVRQGDEHSARVRDMKLAAETGLKMLKSEAAMRDRGAARSRLLEVWEVERHVFGWGTCSWPTDGDLQWRWVGPNGRKHPQVDETMSKDKATAAKEPPCQLGGLYKAVGPWQVETTAATDKDGWVYGMAWSQPEWNKKPGLADVLRRRRWTRPFS